MNKTVFLFLAFTAFTAISGCTLTSPKTTHSINLIKSAKGSLERLGIERVTTSPHTYSVTTKAGKIFFTSIKECGISDKASLIAINRELFVGFEKLQILKSEKIEIANTLALYSLAKANIGKNELAICAYAVRESNCVIELVCWSEKKSINDNIWVIKDECEKMAQELVPLLI